jgi:hypothetical protein
MPDLPSACQSDYDQSEQEAMAMHTALVTMNRDEAAALFRVMS